MGLNPPQKYDWFEAKMVQTCALVARGVSGVGWVWGGVMTQARGCCTLLGRGCVTTGDVCGDGRAKMGRRWAGQRLL